MEQNFPQTQHLTQKYEKQETLKALAMQSLSKTLTLSLIIKVEYPIIKNC